MSIASEISRINQNIAAAYTACQNKGATMPQTQNSANMAAAIASISTGVPGQDLTWDQRQTDVKNYLNTVTYSPSDYSTSSIASYVTTTGHHKPVGASITVPEAGTLTVTDGMGIMTVAVTAGTYTVYNITPGATGMYILRSANDEIVAAGTLKPTGALRMIRLQDSTSGNVRDLGGWSCDGGTVAYGKLFRGSRLFADGSVNDYDKMLMHDFLGIQHELELRYSSEIASEPQYSLIGRDVEWTHIDGAWYSIADSAKCRAMLDCVMDSAIKGIPLYFHCAGGADRTGTLAMMIEAILGVSQSDIDKDYELTCYYSGVATDAQARRRNESEWTDLINAFSGYPGNTLRDKVVAWAITLGIPIETINAFRSAMIDGTPAVLTNPYGNASITKSLTNITINNAASATPMYSPYTATLSAATGYSLSGATVSVTMGSTDITAACYTNGVITIPQVTGALVITATAASMYTNQILHATAEIDGTALYNDIGYKQGYRWTSSNTEDNGVVTDVNDKFTTGYIKVEPGDVVYFYGDIAKGTSGGICTHIRKADTSSLVRATLNQWYKHGTGQEYRPDIAQYITDVDYDTTTNTLRSFRWNSTNTFDGYLHWSCVGTFTEGVTVITINEEM